MTLNHEGNKIRSMAFIYMYIWTHVSIFLYQKFVYILFYEQSIDLQTFVKRRIHRNSLLPIKEPIILILFMPVNHKKKWEKTRGFLLTTKIELEVVPIDTSIFRRSWGTNLLLLCSKEGSINITLVNAVG